jgi:CRP/FNR family transcriptional regulator, dissimilatory nitrate respiration regulator
MITTEELHAKVPALATLPPATLKRLAAAAIERRVAKNARLYRAGDPANGLYLILEGRVRVSREAATHVELLHTESVGGVLGEIPVFGGGEFPATATALAPTRYAYLPIATIQRLLAEDGAFVRFALARLAERARVLLRRIDELTATTVTARVADYLLVRSAASLGTPFTLGMSQEALAEELGTAREVIVRALRALIAAGAIDRAGRSRFVVINETVLRAMATP